MAGMLRISPVQREDGGVTLQVEGKPARKWVGVLERAARWRDLCERLGGRALPPRRCPASPSSRSIV